MHYKEWSNTSHNIIPYLQEEKSSSYLGFNASMLVKNPPCVIFAPPLCSRDDFVANAKPRLLSYYHKTKGTKENQRDGKIEITYRCDQLGMLYVLQT